MAEPRTDEDRAREDAARARLAARGVLVLHEDRHVLGLSKPSGLLSQPGPAGEESLVEVVDAYRREAEAKPGRAYVGLVHRLDRGVSGAMVVAKTSKAAARLAAAFRGRESVEKTYLAWVSGSPPDDGSLATRLVRARGGRVTRETEDDDPEGREASLSFRTEARGRTAARVRVLLGTGVTHQIRAQLSRAGFPIVGDGKYGGRPAPPAARLPPRPALHSLSLVLPHPLSDLPPISLYAPVPPDLLRLDHALRCSPPLAP